MKYTRACHFEVGRSGLFQPTYDLVEHTYQRLAWLYGHDIAVAKVDGTEPETKADLEAWRRLCRHGHAVAQ